MLEESEKDTFKYRLENPNLSYMTKKAIRKKIIDKCKKINKCLNCKEINGVVKKVTANKSGGGGSVLKIGHEKFRGKKDKDPAVVEQMCKYLKGIIK